MKEHQKELEEMRSAMEKLSEEHRVKTALSLQRAHDEYFERLQEAKKEIEEQSKEIDVKAEEISVAKKIYEELKSSFSQKDSVLKQLTAANENLKGSLREKSANWEERNRELVLSLDEANARKEEQEQVASAYREEIEKLKGLLSLSQRKCSEAEKEAKASRKLDRRDELLSELELEKGKVEDQLECKSEQFKHLEETMLSEETYNDFVWHPHHKGWINKPIENYDALTIICGDDQATGSGTRGVFSSSGQRSEEAINIDEDMNGAHSPRTPRHDPLPAVPPQPRQSVTRSNNTPSESGQRARSSGRKRSRHDEEDSILSRLLTGFDCLANSINSGADALAVAHEPLTIKVGRALQDIPGYGFDEFEHVYDVLTSNESQAMLFLGSSVVFRKRIMDRILGR